MSSKTKLCRAVCCCRVVAVQEATPFRAWNNLHWGRYYSSDIKFVNTILDYIYGPFDDRTKLLPALIVSCINNAAEFNLTKGEQKRDYIYIDDVVSAYMKIINSNLNSCSVEIGHAKQISLKDAVLKVKQITNSTINLNFGAVPYREEEPMDLKTNPEILTSLGWKPRYDFETGIKKLISEEYKK